MGSHVNFEHEMLYALEKDSTRVFEKLLLSEKQAQTRRHSPLLCRTCATLVTYAESEIEVAGSTRHECVNPSGTSFKVVCYDMVIACTPVGLPTEEHTWFAGYAWQIADCGSCGIHLGWRFRSHSHEFYGLVEDQLIAGEPETF